MLANNRITRVDSHFADACPKLESLILTNNKISRLEEIVKISETCKGLLRLSLVGNIVSQLPHYRMFVISKMPHLRVLDFQKVTQQEITDSKTYFTGVLGT